MIPGLVPSFMLSPEVEGVMGVEVWLDGGRGCPGFG